MKKKITISTLLSIVVFLSARAQSDNTFIKIVYSERIMNRLDSAQLNLKYTNYKKYFEKKATLFIGDNISSYTYNEYNNTKETYASVLNNKEPEQNNEKDKEIVYAALAKQSILKGFNRIYQKYLSTDTMQINNYQEIQGGYKKYYVLDTLEQIDWKLNDEKKIIANFSCQKAIGAFRGRVWEVWFTGEIPLSSGPWKLRGLPGVILEARDTTGIYSFLVKSIENPVPPPVDGSLIVNRKAERVSNYWLLQIQNNAIREFRNQMQRIMAALDKENTENNKLESHVETKTEEYFRTLKLEFALPYLQIEYPK